MAMAAASPQPQPAKDGNIVVSGNLRSAIGARRTRANDRQATRHPIDADIQEAAQDQPEGKDQAAEYPVERRQIHEMLSPR